MAHDMPRGLSVFHKNIYKVVEDPSLDPIISWGKNNNSFVIWNLEELIRRDVIARFYCGKFSEFSSELKYYGFRRIKKGSGELEFGNEDFVRGQPERMKNMMLRAMKKNKAKFLAKRQAQQEAQKAAERLQHLQM